MNSVHFIGFLGREPEIKDTSNDNKVCKFSLANTVKAAGQDKTTWINCVAWGKSAEVVANYFHKGDSMAIEGRIDNNNWTDKEDVKHYDFVVTVERVHFVGKKNS